MIDPNSHQQLQQSIRRQVERDRVLLDQLREEVRPLRAHVRPIQPRTATSMSLVATDGGSNRLRFDPFLVEIIRVVDSNNCERYLDVVSPTTSVRALAERQFDEAGSPVSPLGSLMAYLGVPRLTELSDKIRHNEQGRPVSPAWVQVYRELVEWAVLFQLVRTREFASDTLLVYDGVLRSKAFAVDLFPRFLRGLEEAMEEQARQHRRRSYLVGVAKHSKVLDRYRLAMALEGVLQCDYPAYVEVPQHLEAQTYLHAEYGRGRDWYGDEGEINRFVGGRMFFVKFGSGRRDPIWPVDLFLPQADQAAMVIGYLLADAQEGFPVPFYPRCLQRAHEHAALVDFDFAVLQDQIFAAIRDVLGEQSMALDLFRLQDVDPARRRYDE